MNLYTFLIIKLLFVIPSFGEYFNSLTNKRMQMENSRVHLVPELESFSCREQKSERRKVLGKEFTSGQIFRLEYSKYFEQKHHHST